MWNRRERETLQNLKQPINSNNSSIPFFFCRLIFRRMYLYYRKGPAAFYSSKYYRAWNHCLQKLGLWQQRERRLCRRWKYLAFLIHTFPFYHFFLKLLSPSSTGFFVCDHSRTTTHIFAYLHVYLVLYACRWQSIGCFVRGRSPL